MFDLARQCSERTALWARTHAYRSREVFARWKRAWAYANERLSPDDAQRVMLDCEHPAGWYPLLVLEVDDVLEQALEDFDDHPGLRSLLAQACARVASKWECHGDELWNAQRWAIDLAEGYATADGIRLRLRDDDGRAAAE
jgi:hypothetical protein